MTPNKAKQKKRASLQESITRLKDKLTLAKSQNDQRMVNIYEVMIRRMEAMKQSA